MILDLLDGPRRLFFLSIKLFGQHPDLCLSLLLRSVSFGDLVLVLSLQLLFLAAQEFEVPTKGFSVAFDASEISFQSGYGSCNVSLLCCDLVLLLLYSLEIIRPLIKSSAKVLDLESVEIQLVTTVIVRSRMGDVFVSEVVGNLYKTSKLTSRTGVEIEINLGNFSKTSLQLFMVSCKLRTLLTQLFNGFRIFGDLGFKETSFLLDVDVFWENHAQHKIMSVKEVIPRSSFSNSLFSFLKRNNCCLTSFMS